WYHHPGDRLAQRRADHQQLPRAVLKPGAADAYGISRPGTGPWQRAPQPGGNLSTSVAPLCVRPHNRRQRGLLPASCPPALLPAMPSKLKPLRIAVAMVLAMWIVALAGRGAHAADTPSFRNEVMAVLSKAGCNLGTCHGNKNGKGGLLLSLRGEWPDTDYRTLTREVHSRRIDRLQPEQSLLLKKPTMQLAHEGGRRLRVGDAQYEILRRWIAAGAPDDGDTAPTPTALEVSPLRQVAYAPADEVQLTVHAVFSDGSRRDVAALAVYEPVDEDMVEVSPSGLVRRAATGETVILVRYLHLQVPVTV